LDGTVKRPAQSVPWDCLRPPFDLFRCSGIDVLVHKLHKATACCGAGSSFGAGIAAMMLAQRLYALPTLLLAPAQDKMCAKARLPLIERHEIEASGCSYVALCGLG
jgi:hypothetical protein